MYRRPTLAQETLLMWRFLAPFRNRKSPTAASRAKKAQARTRSAFCRPRLEWLEQRVVPDVGDTISAALNTHLGTSVGTYTMLSEHLGDGSYGALDVDMYAFKAKAGQVMTATT